MEGKKTLVVKEIGSQSPRVGSSGCTNLGCPEGEERDDVVVVPGVAESKETKVFHGIELVDLLVDCQGRFFFLATAVGGVV